MRYRYTYLLPGDAMLIAGEVEIRPDQGEDDAIWQALSALKDVLYRPIQGDRLTKIEPVAADAPPLIDPADITPDREPEEPEQ